MSEDDTLTVVLIEDDDVAAEAVERSLSRLEERVKLIWAHDGQDGLDVLRGRDPARIAARPRLILLDLNMPRMNGFEFLRAMREDPTLRDEIAFVLTTSDDDTDRSRAYHENIAGYMVKSAVGPQFAKLIQLLRSYRHAVKLPG